VNRQVLKVPRESREVIRNLILYALVFSAAILIFYILAILSLYNLLDIRIVISFGVVEFFAFILAKFFLNKDRSPSIEETIHIVLEQPKFAHLEVHWVDVGGQETYPN
jgi:Ni,Fe-hydrogenase I large subunit